MKIISLIRMTLCTAVLCLTACRSEDINTLALKDINPKKKIVEVELTAEVTQIEYKPGVFSTVWSYNGIVPGPRIVANVGDTLIVHFKNNLPEATTVHWHGLELPANMDGSSIAQNPVNPGESFRYEFKLLRASTYWYHPHMRGNEQVELGLQGMLIVNDRKQDRKLDLPESVHYWVLDDVLLDENGEMIDVGFPDDPVERAKMQVNGREGNTLLVNGLVKPKLNWLIGEPQRIRVVNSSNARFMRLSVPGHTLHRIGGDAGLLEAPIALEEILQVEIPAHDMGQADEDNMLMGCMDDDMPMNNNNNNNMNMMGGMDEMPLTMSDQDLNKGLLLTPGERADFILVPEGEDGDILPIQWHDYKRGRHSACMNNGMVMLDHMMNDGQMAPKTLVELTLVQPQFPTNPNYQPPVKLSKITSLASNDAQVIPVKFGHTAPDMMGNLNFFVQMQDGMGVSFEDITSEMAPAVQVGDSRIIEVTNMTMGDHNFHIHGFMFQHIETQYIDMDNPMNNRTEPAAFLENKDTIRLPRRTGMVMGWSKTITRLAIKFSDEGRKGQIIAHGKIPTESSSGGWLFHCHLLEHSSRGMASFLQVFE